MKPHLTYRPDINGVRGLAVLFVVAFHAWTRILPGGFVGVDIFFVISGYLISCLLFKDIAEDRFSMARFYARRVKRIFPALLAVLAVTVVIGWVLLFPSELRKLGKHLAGGAAFMGNLVLLRGTGYFEETAEFKPLLHLWSLGIEEQFYMFFPLALWAVHRNKLSTVGSLALLLLVSFGFSFYGTRVSPAVTFFNPLTRLWELLVGCLLAAIEQQRQSRTCAGEDDPGPARTIRQVLAVPASGLGLTLIFVSAICLNKQTAYPGGWALLPTIGTALVIWAGMNSLINRLVLGAKVLVGVGLISYPLYLFHWPLLYFGRILSPQGPTPLMLVSIVALSGFLAFLTFKYIECPIRFGKLWGAKKIAFLSIGMGGMLIVGLLFWSRALPSRLGLNPLLTDTAMAQQEPNFPFPNNFRVTDNFRKCAEIARGQSGQAVLFLGDSHMEYYWPRIERNLNRLQTNSRPLIFITAGGWLPFPNVNPIQEHASYKLFDFAMQEAVKTNVSTIVFSAFWEGYFTGGFPNSEPSGVYRADDRNRTPLKLGTPEANRAFEGFGQAIARLTQKGKEVIVILPGPGSLAFAPKAVSRLGTDAAVKKPVRVARGDFESYIRPTKQALSEVVMANGGKTIDPLDFFEEGGFFNGKTPEGRCRYIDNNHMRPFYVIEKATFIDSLIDARLNAISGGY